MHTNKTIMRCQNGFFQQLFFGPVEYVQANSHAVGLLKVKNPGEQQIRCISHNVVWASSGYLSAL